MSIGSKWDYDLYNQLENINNNLNFKKTIEFDSYKMSIVQITQIKENPQTCFKLPNLKRMSGIEFNEFENGG